MNPDLYEYLERILGIPEHTIRGSLRFNAAIRRLRSGRLYDCDRLVSETIIKIMLDWHDTGYLFGGETDIREVVDQVLRTPYPSNRKE